MFDSIVCNFVFEHVARPFQAITKALQPFTLEPDAEPSMPNFDQWTTPSLTNTTGGQNEPDVVTDELDIDIVPGDPDPSKPLRASIVSIGRSTQGSDLLTCVSPPNDLLCSGAEMNGISCYYPLILVLRE